MKVRLIQPTQLDERGEPVKFKKLFLPFLTMPTLAGLTPEGVDVAITEDYVEDVDFDEKVDLVGLTGQTCQAPRAYQIAEAFRKRGTKTVMGGIHASMCPEEALRHVDSVVVGEAEDVWADVVSDARAGSLKRLYRAPGKPDLAPAVIPRFDLLDFRNYVTPPFAHTPLLPIQTSRGCPFDCEFCSVTAFLGRTMRCKPVANVIGEIETARPSRVFFTDDNIVGQPEHARELFKALRPMKLRWSCQMSTTVLAMPDLIERAGEAGCHETFVGIESLNPETLQGAHKGFNKPDRYAELFRRMKDAGILAQASLIYGLDGDTIDSLRKTIDTVLSLDVNYAFLFLLTPFPGTTLFDQVRRGGRLLSEDWSLYDATRAVLRWDGMDSNDLLDVIWEAYGKFYSAPNILKRAWRFRREYVTFFRRDRVIEELFFQFHIRNAVRQHLHPFTLGLRRNGT